jgi:phosphatidylglycerophosphate synthase
LLDAVLRPLKARAFLPVVARIAVVPPIAVTVVGLAFGLLAAVALIWGASWLALFAWLMNRALDGLDGELARFRGMQTDLGGYLDIMADYLVYAALPLALAWQLSTTSAWIAAAVLVASFYVNSASWMFLAAVTEKCSAGGRRATSIAMPGGLVEGSETVLFFTAMLLMPASFVLLAGVMAGLVLLTVLQRVWWAERHL